MKLFVAFCLVAVVAAAPAQQKINYSPDNVEISKYEFDNPGLGNFRYLFEQTDGQQQQQQGELRNEGTEDEILTIKGSYTWVGPDGVTYTVNYVADDGGYQPTIEQGPGGAIPSAVVASLLG